MNLLPLLTPPLLGAFIGWITNLIAIKMLFRPLTPWRLFGLRLPMTPGVIPAKRHELARNIGRMVGAQLLTSADIGRALADPSFKQELASLVHCRLHDLLHRDLGPLATVIPQRFRASFEAGVNILRWRALKVLHGYLDSPQFGQALGATIQAQLDRLLDQPLEAWLTAGPRADLAAVASRSLHQALAGPQAERWLGDFCRQALDTWLAEGKSLADLLPTGLPALIVDRLHGEVPDLLAAAGRLASEPAMRGRLTKTIAGAIGSFLPSLGPMTALVAGFLSSERIEAKIDDYLTRHAEDIARLIDNDQTRAQAQAGLTDKAQALFARPLAELLSELSPAGRAALVEAGVDRLLTVLRRPETRDGVSRLLETLLADQAERSGQALGFELLGVEGLTAAKAWAAGEVVAAIRSAQGKRLLDAVITRLLNDHLLDQPLGPLAKLLPKDVQSGCADYLVQQGHDLLLAEAPRLFELINIQQIVTRKVDSLDLLRLEQLLLGIMEEQFKYINLFGGLLGFIIGLINLCFLP